MPESAPDSVDAFARDLRTARHDAGNPTVTGIEKSSGVSKSVVSEAFTGRRLPSARTVRGIVGALDGDVEAWIVRRDALAATLTSDDGAETGAVETVSDPTVEPSTPKRGRTVSLRAAVIAAAVALLVGAGGTFALQGGLSNQAAAQGSPTGTTSAAARALAPTTVVPPQISVENGTDPADTKCVDDAVVAASETGPDNMQLQIVYSADCHAVWSRITRYDNRAAGNVVSTSIYRQIAPNASDRQSTTEPDAQSAYTTLHVRPTPQTRMCAVGSVTVAGKTVDFGKTVCL